MMIDYDEDCAGVYDDDDYDDDYVVSRYTSNRYNEWITRIRRIWF